MLTFDWRKYLSFLMLLFFVSAVASLKVIDLEKILCYN